MRIVIVGLNFAPELTGVGKYTGEMAAWLAKRGHEVAIITTRPYYPEWKRTPGWRRFTWQTENWNSCKIIRCPLYVPSNMTGAQRMLHLASYAASSSPAALMQVFGRHIDVVAAIAPTLFSAPVALSLARVMRAKTWLHFQDLEFDAAFELGIVKSRRFMAGAMKVERHLATRFDLVSAISPKMVDAVARKGVRQDRLMLFPNWVDMRRIFPLPAPHALRHELGIPEEQCVVLYSGSMGRKQGLEYVIAAARILAEKSENSPLFVLAGGGPVRAEIEAAARNLPNVRFLPLQSEDRFNEFINIGDIHLLPQRLDAADLVMPSKLGAILAAGKPVIATAPPDSQIALTIGAAGIVIPPENAQALATAISELAEKAGLRLSMGEKALEIAQETLDAGITLTRLETQLEKLVSPGGLKESSSLPNAPVNN